MPRLLAALLLGLLLTGCSAFSAPPKLPEPPAGAEALAGDGAWEAWYDLAVIEWHDSYDRPFDSQDYWLTTPMTPAEVFAHYAPALDGWAVNDRIDRRGRWVGRDYRKDGRVVALAVFPTTSRGGEFDALRVLVAPRP